MRLVHLLLVFEFDSEIQGHCERLVEVSGKGLVVEIHIGVLLFEARFTSGFLELWFWGIIRCYSIKARLKYQHVPSDYLVLHRLAVSQYFNTSCNPARMNRELSELAWNLEYVFKRGFFEIVRSSGGHKGE
jgi:hypothetical protein